MSSKSDLKVDWATHTAAEHACTKWHYSKCMPTGKLIKVGAWENGQFIGVVIFSRGASPFLGKKFSLTQLECCELTRVALTKHDTPVTRVVAVAIKFLRKNSPGMRLIVSFADPVQGHHGGIYQAGNWIYTGQSGSTVENFLRGKWRHMRGSYHEAKSLRNPVPTRIRPGKHRYIYILDESLRKSFSGMARPYPARGESKENVAPSFQEGEGGVNPTSPLQLKQGK